MEDFIKTAVSDQADFAFTLSEPYFEPMLKVGDTVAFKNAKDIEVGEYGIFSIEGKPVLRQKGNGVIRSMNPDVPDHPIDENVICVGKLLGKLYKSPEELLQ